MTDSLSPVSPGLADLIASISWTADPKNGRFGMTLEQEEVELLARHFARQSPMVATAAAAERGEELSAPLKSVVGLARRNIMREQTDFIGRMHQAMGGFEVACEAWADGESDEAGRDDAAENIAELAGLALAQLAMVRDPSDPLAALSNPAPAEPVGVREDCDLPPAGWICTRGKGHDGPCAARRPSRWDGVGELVDLLCSDEGATVTFTGQNPDFNGLPNECVIVFGPTTGWQERDFRADMLVDCLRAALSTSQAQA